MKTVRAAMATGLVLLALPARPGMPEQPAPERTVEPAKNKCESGNPTRVPPLKGMPLDQARKMLEARKLTASHRSTAPGEAAFVTETNPYRHAEICSGTPVRLLLGSRPVSFRMVSVQGMLLKAARAELHNVGLTAASVRLHACGRSVSAMGAECDSAFEVAAQWPDPDTELPPDTQARLWLRRVDSPSASTCADDGSGRNALAWRTRQLPTVPVPPEVRAAAARVDTVLTAAVSDGFACEVSVLPVEIARPQPPTSGGHASSVAPAVILAAGSAPLIYRIWRRREARGAAAADTGLPALPAPRVIVDVPRREDA